MRSDEVGQQRFSQGNGNGTCADDYWRRFDRDGIMHEQMTRLQASHRGDGHALG
jgi:hypothetical protein